MGLYSAFETVRGEDEGEVPHWVQEARANDGKFTHKRVLSSDELNEAFSAIISREDRFNRFMIQVSKERINKSDDLVSIQAFLRKIKIFIGNPTVRYDKRRMKYSKC